MWKRWRPELVLARSAEVLVVDVRTPAEYASGHVALRCRRLAQYATIRGAAAVAEALEA